MKGEAHFIDQIVRTILNLASREWKNKETNLTWMNTAPKINLLDESDAAKPYPLAWPEQRSLFSCLAPHLLDMATFMVNTGLRDQELCFLSWEWEVRIPEFNRSMFVIPGVIKPLQTLFSIS